jgi:site-specific DNA recombinase
MTTTASYAAYAYVRVSGDEQADRGLPVAGQREEIARYAAGHGLHVARWFVDEARPGSSDRRDQFQEMMRLAHSTPPPVGAVVLWSWSRFARDSDDAHFWKSSLRRHGVEVLSIAEPIPDNLPAGFDYVLEAAIHWSDARRLEEISHDARRGQQTLVRAGFIPSGCRPPRGYQVELVEGEFSGKRRALRRWVPDPDLWPLAHRAWQLRLRGAGYSEILRECPGLYKTPSCLTTFFANTAYKGVVTFGGTPIAVEAMVSEEEWARVNANRTKRESGAYARREGGHYLLSGLLRCARCGALLVGHRTYSHTRNDGYGRSEWTGYRCPGRRSGRCDLPQISTQTIEQALISQLIDEVLTPEHLTTQAALLRAELDADRPAVEAQARIVREQLDRAEAAVERLLDVLEQTTEVGSVLERLRRREAERDALAAQLREVEQRLAGPDMEGTDATEWHSQLREALEAGLPQARQMLRRLIVEIRVDHDGATVRYRVPF